MPNSCKSVSGETKKKSQRKLFTFNEARKIARSMGFHSQDEFVDYECAGSYQLPKNVDELYAKEWKGWGDFLGVPLPFDEAKSVARELSCLNKEDYFKLKEQEAVEHSDDSDIDIDRLPYKPNLFYKEWTNWEDWLGL